MSDPQDKVTLNMAFTQQAAQEVLWMQEKLGCDTKQLVSKALGAYLVHLREIDRRERKSNK